MKDAGSQNCLKLCTSECSPIGNRNTSFHDLPRLSDELVHIFKFTREALANCR